MAILDGNALAATVLSGVKEAFGRSALARPPRVAIVLANSRADSRAYVRRKLRALSDVGFDARLYTVGAKAMGFEAQTVHTCARDVSQAVAHIVSCLDADDSIDGILVQRPIDIESADCSHSDTYNHSASAFRPLIPTVQVDMMPSKRSMANASQNILLPHGSRVPFVISAQKDVDGLRPETLGMIALRGTDLTSTLLPCTGLAVMALVRTAMLGPCTFSNGADPAPDTDSELLRGLAVTVVGRSAVAGLPCALLAMRAGATVTVCHTGTADLAGATRTADVVVSAAGVPNLITADHVRPGAVVIDVGISRTPDRKIVQTDCSKYSAIETLNEHPSDNGNGKRASCSPGVSKNRMLVGDVDFESVSKVARAVTPVPGGVGPVTVAMFVRNVLCAALFRRNLRMDIS